MPRDHFYFDISVFRKLIEWICNWSDKKFISFQTTILNSLFHSHSSSNCKRSGLHDPAVQAWWFVGSNTGQLKTMHTSWWSSSTILNWFIGTADVCCSCIVKLLRITDVKPTWSCYNWCQHFIISFQQDTRIFCLKYYY